MNLRNNEKLYKFALFIDKKKTQKFFVEDIWLVYVYIHTI